MDFLSFMLCLVVTYFVHKILLVIKKSKGDYSNSKKLPPGPPGLPIVGNLFALGSKPHINLTELAKTYGPLMCLQLGQVQIVVISSPAVAKEALHQNDLLFSERHTIDAVRALNHHEKTMPWIPIGLKWRVMRKICSTQMFSPNKLDATRYLRRSKLRDLVAYVNKSRETGVAVDIGQAAFTTTLNSISHSIFSMDLCDLNSDLAVEYKKIVTLAIGEMGKPNFADYFPILKRLDAQGIRRRMGVQITKLMDHLKAVIDSRMQGKRPLGSTQGTDVLDALLGITQEHIEAIDPSDVPDFIANLFIAGTDTTATVVEWAMAELIHKPEKMNKARAELNEIIGKGNTVEESDIPKLSYLQAIVKEVFRMHPPVAILPRKAGSDVNLFEFTVPKNSQVLVNVWGIGRDPNLWENPNSFEPERFLVSNIDVKGHDFELIPFGAGRRMCPGWPLANRMLHLMLASLIHGFDWKLEGGILPEDMNMEEICGFTMEKAQHLRAIPVNL